MTAPAAIVDAVGSAAGTRCLEKVTFEIADPLGEDGDRHITETNWNEPMQESLETNRYLNIYFEILKCWVILCCHTPI